MATSSKQHQNETPRTSGNAHDKFFRSLFVSAAKVRNVFKMAFSEQQLAHFDLDSITVVPRVHIPELCEH